MFLLGLGLFCTIFGFGAFRYLKLRKKQVFFNDFLLFLNNIDTQVGFFQNKTEQIFDSKEFHDEFNCFLSNAKQSVLKCDIQYLDRWFKTQSVVLREDLKRIKDFFYQFGKVDVKTQQTQIRAFRHYVENRLNIELNNFKTKGKLSLSLSAMLAIAVFIIVL